MTASSAGRSWRPVVDLTLVVLALAAVLRLFWWTEAVSGGFNPPGEEDYYNFLVRGWRQGHLYMAKEPRSEMLTLKDPYDPAQNHDVRLGDASYYREHYYLYFSAAPAVVLHLPYYALTGRELGTTTAVYVYGLIGFLAASAVWLAIRRRYFPASGVGVGAGGILMLGLSTHLLVLARRPLVWELPIAAAFAFVMLALLAIFWAFHGRRPVLAMAGAGVSFGLAIASRPGELFGAAMFLPALWFLRQRPGMESRWRWGAVAAAIGIGVCLAAVFWHNYARFGDPLEFGVNYQLTSSYEAKQRHFSLTYMAHNAGIYFFHPAKWSTVFPYIEASGVRGGPSGYLGDWVEPIAGLAVSFPFLWLVLGTPLAAFRPAERESGGLRAMVIVTATLASAIIGFFLCFYCATTRYMVEFAPALTLLAGFGWLGLERRARTAGRKMALVALVGLAVCVTAVTAVTAVLLSFDYHNRFLQRLSPQLWTDLERGAERWRARLPGAD